MATRTSTRKGSGRRRVSNSKSNTKKKRRSQRTTLGQRLVAFPGSVRHTLRRQTDDVWGLVLLVLAVLATLAFVDGAGPFGEGFETVTRFLFGVWRYALPVAMAGVGIALITGKPRGAARRLVVGGITTFIGTLALFHLLTGAVSLRPSIELVEERGGAVGALIAFPMRRLLGFWGSFVVLSATVGAGGARPHPDQCPGAVLRGGDHAPFPLPLDEEGRRRESARTSGIRGRRGRGDRS
ncbi:MAG TPA: hypothetical protein EYP73_02095 [Acidimicrobiia bacterium]|nr:hypothetical protein [Acidimicrobiia bacterium]